MTGQFFNTEYFIELIRERPTIWDVETEEYSNKKRKQQCWNEVFSLMVKDFNKLPEEKKKRKSSELQRRWKSLRSSFAREMKIRRSKSGEEVADRKTYVYFQSLSFLRSRYRTKGQKSSLDPEVQSQEPEENTEEFLSSRECAPKKTKELENTENQLKEVNETLKEPIRLCSVRDDGDCAPKKKKRLEYTENQLREPNEILKEPIRLYSVRDDDDDKLFLLSLHTHLKTIPESNKLFAKAELIQVLMKYNDPPQFDTTRFSRNCTKPSTSYTPVTHHLIYPPNVPQYYPLYHSVPNNASTPALQTTHFPVPYEESSSVSVISNESS